MSPWLWIHWLAAGAAVTKVFAETAIDIGADMVLGHYEDKSTQVTREYNSFTTDASHRPVKVSYVDVRQVRKRGIIPRTVQRTLVTGNLYQCFFCGRNIHTVLLPEMPIKKAVARASATIVKAGIECRHVPQERVLS